MNRSAFQFNFLLHACNINCCYIYYYFIWYIYTINITLEHVTPHTIYYFENRNESFDYKLTDDSPKVVNGVFVLPCCCLAWENHIAQ